MNGNQCFRIARAVELIHLASRPSWRQKGNRVSLPKPGAGTSLPDWAEHRRKPGWDGPSSRILGLILLALTIPALLMAWVWLFPDQESTPMLAISVTDYRAPVPPNAFAAEDVARMREAYDAYHNIVLSEPPQAPKDSASLLSSVKSFLDQAQPGGPDKNVVMIYLSAHGLVNANGEPCLLLPDHKPLDCTTWLPISKLMETITQAPHLEACQKIVLLDVTRIDDAWRMGVFANTFAIALQSLLSETRPANCFVINASTGLETAFAAPELSGTAFGYHVTAGLRGAADAFGNDNGVVTLDELAIYLRQQVDGWALSRRAVHQRPSLTTMIAGSAAQPTVESAAENKSKQVRLAYVTGEAEIPAPPWSPQETADASLWERIAQFEKRRAYALSPHKWGFLQFLVERYDAELLAGSAYSDQAGHTFGELSTLLDEIERDAQHLYPMPVSLAMQQRLDEKNDVQSVAAIWDAWLKNPAEAKAPVDYRLAADFTWQRLAAGNSRVDQTSLRQALDFCDFAGGPQHGEFSEIALLRLLDTYVDWAAPAMANASELQRLIVARRESERLAAPTDPRQHYAITQSMEKCDTDLAVAFDDILTGNEDSLRHAKAKLDMLLGQGEGSYGPVLQQSDLLRQALVSRDHVFATLLPITRFVAMSGRFEKSFRTKYDLTALADQTLELASLIDTTIAESTQHAQTLDEDRLHNLIQQIDHSLNEILGWYNQRVADIPKQEGGSSSAIQAETPQLLRCPIEFSTRRMQLRAEWIKQLQRSSDAKRSSSDKLDELDESRHDIEFLHWLATSGLQPLEKLLNWQLLAGDDRLGVTPFRLSGVQHDASADGRSKLLAQLGGSLRARRLEMITARQTLTSISTQVVARQPAFQARRGFALADRLTRQLAPLTTDRSEFAEGEPALQLRSLDTQALILWHGHRLLDDFWGTWKPLSKPYFAEAASRLAKQAEETLLAAEYGPRELLDRIKASQQTLSDWQPLQADTLAHSDESMLRHEVGFRARPDVRPGQAAVYLTDKDNHLFVTYDSSKLQQRRRGIDTGGGQLRQPSAIDRINHQISGKDLRDEDLLYANALFRGHVKKTPFTIGRGVSVPWQKPAPASASIVVRGDAKQISQLIFIVDCSGSMGRKLAEGKAALANILNILIQQDGKYRVGLVFYGRRARWVKGGTGTGKDAYVPDGPQGINPDADVEIAVHPALLNETHIAVIKRELGPANPNGQTPLYLALHTALGMMDTTIAGPRHIVAITDGVDDIYDVPSFPPPIRKTALSVAETRQGVQARIDVIEFGGKTDFEGDNLESLKWETGRGELRAITQRSGGSFQSVETADTLADELKNALRLDRYYLQAQAGAAAGLPQELHELGSATRLDASILPLDFQVLLEEHTTDVAEGRVEGGEALRLVYRHSTQNRLGYERYDPDDRRETRELKELRVANHVPAGQLNQPTFRVSIQNRNERWFSPRPAVVWAKVTPVGSTAPRSFYFVDRQFELNLPVPMLRLPARGWSGSEFARVELSFAMTRSALGEQTFPIPAIGNEQYQSHGATLQVDSKREGSRELVVTVEEKHSEKHSEKHNEKHNEKHSEKRVPGANSFPLHIQIDPQPDRIKRTYFEADGRAHYVFYYDVQPSNPKLLVLSRQEIEAQGTGPIVFEKVELPRY